MSLSEPHIDIWTPENNVHYTYSSINRGLELSLKFFNQQEPAGLRKTGIALATQIQLDMKYSSCENKMVCWVSPRGTPL